MIIFHEGLPRSGKSYEACINQILPALLKPRHVYAFVDGLNFDKFAEVSGLSLEQVKEYLHILTEDQIKDVQNHVANDSLVVIDELQNYWPVGKNSLDDGITEFVTKHGHRGIDIVCMGQDHRDCHLLWKRRIDRLISFTKRDAVGQAKSYTWRSYKLQGRKFVELRSGKGSYDPKYFGLYKSHDDGVSSIDDNQDDRANIFKSSVFTFWIPLFIACLAVAGYYLWGFFHNTDIVKLPPRVPDPVVSTVTNPLPVNAPHTGFQSVNVSETTSKPPDKPTTKAIEYSNFIEKFLEEYRPRLASVVLSRDKKLMLAKIDFYQSERIYQSFNIEQLKEFGYLVEYKTFGVLISKNGKQYPVTPWPLDLQRNVPDKVKPELGHYQ